MARNFTSWLTDKVLEEGVFGNWEYKIPADKKQQMYDFYMLENLLPPGRKDHLLKDKEKDNPKPPADRSHEEEFHHAVEDTANKLLPTLKSELLEVVMFSIAAELRHLFDRSENKAGAKPYQNLFEAVSKNVGPAEANLLKKYTLNMINYKNPDTKDLLDREKIPHNLADSNSGYKSSYRAMKAAGGSDEQWARLAEWLYLNAKWNGSYGGKPWASIAAGWQKLNSAKSAENIINYIDHVYDLQHNTDTVFNKIASYAKEGGYSWVKEALDHKRYLASPHEMIEHVSPAMRQLALTGIKVIDGKTWEDFEKEWPEILKKKTAVYNQTKQIEYEKNKAKGMTWGGPPTPLTPEQFAQSQIKSSNSPWSIYKVHQKHKASTLSAPSPYAGGATSPYASPAPAAAAGGWFAKPKKEAIPGVFKDAAGKDIQIGDTVKKETTSLNNIGKVTALLPNGTVTVLWNAGYDKTYPAAELVVMTPVAAPAVAPTPATPTPVVPEPLDKFNIGDKVSSKMYPDSWYTVTKKEDGNLIVLNPFGSGQMTMHPSEIHGHKKAGEPLTPTPKPTPVPAKAPNPYSHSPVAPSSAFKNPAKTKSEITVDKIKNLWTSLPKSAKSLKIARLVRGAQAGMAFSDVFDLIEKTLDIKLDQTQRDGIIELYHEETDKNNYYSARSHNQFPKNLTKDQAWDLIKMKYPNPPHVYLNNDVENEITELLKQDHDIKAVSLIRNATQFDLAAAKGLTVLKKLELLAENEGHSFSDEPTPS